MLGICTPALYTPLPAAIYHGSQINLCARVLSVLLRRTGLICSGFFACPYWCTTDWMASSAAQYPHVSRVVPGEAFSLAPVNGGLGDAANIVASIGPGSVDPLRSLASNEQGIHALKE